MADNVVVFRCSTVICPHLLLSPPHFQNSLSTFLIASYINGIPLWDFHMSDFQRALKIIIIAKLFIVMTISPGRLKATFHLTISMREQRATGKIQRNKYYHGSCGPSLMGKTSWVSLIFTQGTHRNVKNR